MARITRKRALKKLKAAAREARELRSKANEVQGKAVDDTHFIEWRDDTRAHIEDVFGTDLRRLREFERIKYAPHMQPNAPDEEWQRYYVEGLEKALALLESMVVEVRDWPDSRWTAIIAVAAIVTIIVGMKPIIATIRAMVEYVQRFFTR